MRVSWFAIKCAIFAVVLFIWNVFLSSFAPIIENDLALHQMTNSADSSMYIQAFTYCKNYAWVAFVLFALVLFRKELVYLVKFLKRKLKDEETE